MNRWYSICLFSSIGTQFNGQNSLYLFHSLECSTFDCIKFICYTKTFEKRIWWWFVCAYVYTLITPSLYLLISSLLLFWKYEEKKTYLSHSFHLHENENTIIGRSFNSLLPSRLVSLDTNVYVFSETFILFGTVTTTPNLSFNPSQKAKSKSTSLLLSYQCIYYMPFILHSRTCKYTVKSQVVKYIKWRKLGFLLHMQSMNMAL